MPVNKTILLLQVNLGNRSMWCRGCPELEQSDPGHCGTEGSRLGEAAHHTTRAPASPVTFSGFASRFGLDLIVKCLAFTLSLLHMDGMNDITFIAA